MAAREQEGISCSAQLLLSSSGQDFSCPSPRLAAPHGEISSSSPESPRPVLRQLFLCPVPSQFTCQADQWRDSWADRGHLRISH